MGDNFSEIYLLKSSVDSIAWGNLLDTLGIYNGLFNYLKVIICLKNNEVRYFVKTQNELPPTINNLSDFLFKSCMEVNLPKIYTYKVLLSKIKNSTIDIINYLEIKNKGTLKYVEIDYKRLSENQIIKRINIYVDKMGKCIKYHLIMASPKNMLAINFQENKRYLYMKMPKYLDMSKSLQLLNTDKALSILKVDTFPYLQGNFYLKQNAYSFNKHSVIMGTSGAGKSKFICSFIENIFKNFNLKNNYKFIIIDPHASMPNDIGAFSDVIDFVNKSSDLFKSNSNEDIISQTELFLELFKSIIADQYNSKLERVLRHSIYLLLQAGTLNFTYLKKLLLDAEYRNELINKERAFLPQSINSFFLADFNELKTKSYNEAISPIIAFIDEMQMIPFFNNENNDISLEELIKKNFITLFSLDRNKLGDKCLRTIAGLIMQKVFTLVQNHITSEHIIFIVDEVSTVESPILSRFLSEMRKYNLSIFLSGQYFNQISSKLQEAIFANVSNYYLFKLSKNDANILVNNIDFKIPLEDTIENKIKLLTELEDRKCLVRINNNGKLIPGFIGKTVDYVSKPANFKILIKKENKIIKQSKEFRFNNNTKINLKDILKSQSASRKEVNNE